MAAGDPRDADGVVRAAGSARLREYCEITGVVREVAPVGSLHRSCDVVVADATGAVRCRFLGVTALLGIRAGCRLRVAGRLVRFQGRRCLLNPRYELLDASCAESS